MRLSLNFFIIGLLMQAPPVYAQDIERAKSLFEEASSLREAGLYEEAIARLRQAIAIKDTPGLEYHTGYCEAKLNHFRVAIRYYERAAALLRSGASAPDVVTLLPPAHAFALEHVARLQIDVSERSPATRLRLDEEPEQAVPEGDLLVDAGSHRLLISASGFKPEERRITVAQAERLKIDVRLTPLVSEVRPGTESAPSSFPWKTVSIGAGLGVTAAGLGLGIVSVAKRHAAQGRIALYGGLPNSGPELGIARSDKESATRWETVGFVAAGVGAAATAALWTLWPASRHVAIVVDTGRPSSFDSRVTFATGF
jgi:hypothetical protein